MNDKELNLAILAELNNIAKRIFDKLIIKPGTYSASELAKQKDSNGNVIYMCWDNVIKELYPNEIPAVEVGPFKCSFAPNQIFRYVWIFEKLAGVRDDKKMRFTKIKPIKNDLLCEFTIEIEKCHLTLCKLTSKDSIRPIMMQVYMDIYNKCLVACSGNRMRIIPFKIDCNGELPERMILYINPKHLKGMAGKNKVEVYPNEGFYKTVVTNCQTGTIYENATAGIYPDYRAIFPKLRKDGYIRFEAKELKTIKSFCKAASKASYFDIVTMYIKQGDKYALLSYIDDKKGAVYEKSFRLAFPANMTIRIGLGSEQIYALHDGWNGGMWLLDPMSNIVMDYNKNGAGLIIRKVIDDWIFPDECKCDINPFDRESYIEEIESAEQPVFEQPDYLPAVPVETSANVIPHICAIQAITDVFSGIVKAAIKEKKKSRQTANIWTIIQAINAACKNPIFGECKFATVENTVKAEGRKSPISNKVVLKPCNELSGGMRVIVRNGGGIAPTEKETHINTGLLIRPDKANGIHKIRDGTMLHNADGMKCITNKMNDDGNSFDMYYCLLCGRA